MCPCPFWGGGRYRQHSLGEDGQEDHENSQDGFDGLHNVVRVIGTLARTDTDSSSLKSSSAPARSIAESISCPIQRTSFPLSVL